MTEGNAALASKGDGKGRKGRMGLMAVSELLKVRLQSFLLSSLPPMLIAI